MRSVRRKSIAPTPDLDMMDRNPATSVAGVYGQTVRVRHLRGKTFLFSGNSVWVMKGDHAVPYYAWDDTSEWYDLNGDGLMQNNEKSPSAGPHIGSFWGDNMSDDLTFEHFSGNTVYRRPVIEWRNGLPIWQRRDAMRPAFTIDIKGERGLDPVCAVMWSPFQQRCYVLETERFILSSPGFQAALPRIPLTANGCGVSPPASGWISPRH